MVNRSSSDMPFVGKVTHLRGTLIASGGIIS